MDPIKKFFGPQKKVFRTSKKSFLDLKLFGLQESTYFTDRVILSSTHKTVLKMNSTILSMLPGTEHHLFSIHTPENEEQLSNYPVEIFNNFNIPCLPDHEIILKKNTFNNLNTVCKT